MPHATAPAHAPAASPGSGGPTPRSIPPVGLGLAAAVVLLHLVVNATSPYGFHRDEFLYMAMGEHLRILRMDFPPLIAILAELSRGLLGDSLVALRVTPALAHGALVALAAVFARETGGGRGSQALAALAVALAPLYLRAGSLFQPVVFDQLWWTLGLWCLIRIGRARSPGEERRWWVALGVTGGVGLLTKFSIFFFGFGAMVGLLLSPLRRRFATPWPWAAAALALSVGSPSLIGQALLDWPVVGQMSDLQASQLERVSHTDFLAGQVLALGPALLLALAGWWTLVASPAARHGRAAAWAAAASFLLLMALHGKPYYAGPVFPALIGVGSAVVGRAAATLATRGRRATGAVLARGALGVVVAYGVAVLPMGVPVLPPEPMARYASALGVTAATTTNRGEVLELPQDYADMLGWEALARTVARVYRELPPTDRARAVIVAENYGEAGAIDFYGPGLDLPKAVAPVGSYWFFGPGEKPGHVIVKVGGTRDGLSPYFDDVRWASVVDEPWVVPEERELPIWVARRPRVESLQAIWPLFEGQN